MKRFSLVLLLAVLTAGSAFAGNKNTTLDLDGLPDLWVYDNLDQQWVVRDEKLSPTACSVIEGGIEPGIRRLVRFTVTTPNSGDADLFVGDPNSLQNKDLFEFASCHNHLHFKNYATYELIDPRNGHIWRAAKRGFCMLDTDPLPSSQGNEPPRAAQFRNCGTLDSPGYQGISHGWMDTYRFFLGGQFFVLDGGDGQAPVPPGTYQIRVTVNPPYAPNNKGQCPLAKDAATGLCHNFAESDYTNNVRTVTITIPDHPGRAGVGPLKNEPELGYEPIDHQ